MAATECRSEELAALAKAIEKSRDLAKSEHSLELEQLVSRVAYAMRHIGAMLALEAVERVWWHRGCETTSSCRWKSRKLVDGCWENGGSLVGNRTRQLQPIKRRRQFPREFPALSEPAGSHAED